MINTIDMKWTEVIDPKYLPYTRNRVLAQDEYGNIGVVYWNNYDWVYHLPNNDDEINMPGKIVSWIIID
jgi:hypothetical protein